MWRTALIILLSFFLLGSRGCITTETVVLPEGPVAARLAAEKDKQIAGLVAQVKSEQEARELEQAQAALVAANLEGILFAAEHVPTGLPRAAIEEEAKLGKERSPPADPTELLKAKDRVIAILNGEVEKAKALYGAASTEAAQAKAQIAAKDEEIAKRDKALQARATEIETLTLAAQAEREKHANDVKSLIKGHQDEVNKLKQAYANKQQQLWLLGIRGIGLFFILAGGIAIIVFKRLPEGALGIGLGLLIGVVSVGFDKLVSAPWFPVAFGVLVLIAVGAGIYALYRVWLKHQLHNKTTAAIQDLIDEATIKGDTKTVDELKAHLKYRMGDSTTFFGRAQKAEVAALGLIDKKGEEALKSTGSSTEG